MLQIHFVPVHHHFSYLPSYLCQCGYPSYPYFLYLTLDCSCHSLLALWLCFIFWCCPISLSRSSSAYNHWLVLYQLLYYIVKSSVPYSQVPFTEFLSCLSSAHGGLPSTPTAGVPCPSTARHGYCGQTNPALGQLLWGRNPKDGCVSLWSGH